MLWSSVIVAGSLAAGFIWVHFGLRSVLEARNDAFLERKAAELLAVLRDSSSGGETAFRAEVHREVVAYEAEGLVVIVRSPSELFVAPSSEKNHALARGLAKAGPLPSLETAALPGTADRFRVIRIELPQPARTLELGLALAETEATLDKFDGRVAAGGLVFLVLAALSGWLLSRQALRPVASSIRSARGLNPESLTARLPLTGSGDELDELAGTINSLLDRLASYHTQIIRFTADASHELRSPLAAMRAAVEITLSQPRNALEYREVLSSLGEQCDRLTTLVNGLLLLARADAGEVALQLAPVELQTLVDRVVEIYEPLAEERGISLTVRARKAVTVLGDSARLMQLITNLVDNALKFTEPGGSATLQIERDETHARLIVRDTGLGISELHLPHIFERFYQVSSARSTLGCGLGLSICRWIAVAHAGSIEVESRRPVGTAFTVTLPLAISDHPYTSG
jgi:heavy metal sensor kinase